MAGPLLDELLSRCDFPLPGTAAACAVSGGPDSLALLILAVAARLAVTAIHVDHGLRAGSAAEARVVEAAAADLGAEFACHTVMVEPGPNLEARARAARYAILPAGVMTGHSADDLAETMLINLLRGAGLDGLSPMRGGEGRILRPILGLRRAETRRLCAATGIVPVHDESNEDVRFVRNRVRHDLLPLMADIAGRDPVPILVRQAALVGEEAALLDRLAEDLDPTDARALRAGPEALARRAIRRWLRATAPDPEQHPPSAAEVARVLEVVRGQVTACQVSGGRTVRRSHGRLTIVGACGRGEGAAGVAGRG